MMDNVETCKLSALIVWLSDVFKEDACGHVGTRDFTLIFLFPLAGYFLGLVIIELSLC